MPGAADGSAALLQELREKGRADLARWALAQLRELAAPGARPEALPLAKAAAALPRAPREELEELARALVAGLAALPAKERADSLKLALCSSEGSSGPPALVKNAGLLVRAANLEEMDEETLCAVAGAAAEEAKQSVRMEHVVEAMAALGAGEREQLTDILVEAKVVPEQQRGAVGEALKPGGPMDRLKSGLSLALVAYQWAPALLLLPPLEFLLAYGRHMRGSGALAQWIRLDSWITMAIVLAGLVGALALWPLAPLFRRFLEDPMGTYRRCVEDGGPEALLRSSGAHVPVAICSAVALAVLAFCSVCWGAVGALLAPLALLFGAGLRPFLICGFIIGLRVGSVLPLLEGYAALRKHFQRARPRPAA